MEESVMKKVRKFSWFLLLVILFAAFAGLSVAQENPNAVDSHLTRRDSNVEAVLSPPSDVARAVTEISTAGADRTPELAGTFVGLPERTPLLSVRLLRALPTARRCRAEAQISKCLR